MSQFFNIHPDNPQIRLIIEAVKIIKQGGVVIYPTDSAYAIGCRLGEKDALKRIKNIRKLDDKHNFTLMCRDLSEISRYAKVPNATFRALKAFTPGPYTFILPATKEVPRMLMHPKRKNIGIRIPENHIAQDILEQLDEPLLSTTLTLPDHELPLIEPEAIADILGKQVDLVIDGGYCGVEQTSVIQFEGDEAKILRYGKGDVSAFE